MTQTLNDRRKRHVTFLLLLAVAVSILFFQMIQGFVVAVLLAAIFAGLDYPVYTRLAGRLGGRKPLAALVTVVLMLLCVVIPTLVFLSLVADEAVSVGESVGPWVKQHIESSDVLDQLFDKVPFLHHLAPYKNQILQESAAIPEKAAGFVASSMAGLTEATAKFCLLLFVFLYAKFQFLLDGTAMRDRIMDYVPLSAEDRRRTVNTFTSVARATLVSAGLIGVIQGGLAGLAFAVAGIHGAILWTAVMAVMSIIPGIGATIIWVPAVIFLAVEGRFTAAIGLGLWCAIVVGSVDNFLRPRLIGKGTQMPNLLTLLGTLGGVVFFGPVGIILGPVVAALFMTAWQMYASALKEGTASPLPGESTS